MSQTIKQMQQRMLELKKTLQKELVSAPLLPSGPTWDPFHLMMLSFPQLIARGPWEVRCWLVGQWPCQLEYPLQACMLSEKSVR